MAGMRSLLNLSKRVFASTLRREISISSRASTLVAINPVPHIRPDASGLETLKEKEKGPWAELSIEEKVQLYRSQFPMTMKEQDAGVGPSGKQVFAYTSVLISIAIVYFVFLRKYVGPEAPRTLTDEWKAASVEKMKRQRSNPISGISSK